jgi:hypothetical protein
MLQSYPANLLGNQVIWLGATPPPRAQAQRVVVVLEEQPDAYPSDDLTVILNRARGCLGKGQREAVLAELSHLRNEWDV